MEIYGGDKKKDRGDTRVIKVILYAAQADAVLKAIERDGRCPVGVVCAEKIWGKRPLFS